MISLVLPVFNEELILEKNVLRVFDFCQKNLPPDWQIIISDNHSSDHTRAIGERLSSRSAQIKYLRLNKQGKGLAVISAWQNFRSDIYIFMDIDLSVDLNALPGLIAAIQSGADIAAGSRFLPDSVVERSFIRKLFSVFLKSILKLVFNSQIKDAPCGFKAVNQKIITHIVPHIKNQTWFFDTEMLVLAAQAGYKIKEIAVVWQESKTADRKSKVGPISVAFEYLKNIIRLYFIRRN